MGGRLSIKGHGTLERLVAPPMEEDEDGTLRGGGEEEPCGPWERSFGLLTEGKMDQLQPFAPST